MNYLTYLPTTGEIVTWGSGGQPAADSAAGTVLITNVSALVSPTTHFVSNGSVVAYSSGQMAAKAARPTYPVIWSNTTFTWIDQRTLDQAKADTWDDIKTARDAELYDSFVWDGSRFDSDQVSQTRIQGAVQLATIAISQGQHINITWTLYDNTTRALSEIDFVQLGIALGTFVSTIFAAGVILRNQIDAATTLSQVDAIKWVNIF